MSIERRLARLQKVVRGKAASMTVFEVEGGGTWSTEREPLDYLRRCGAVTPSGKKITGWQRPEGAMDPLSSSLCDLVDAVIAGFVPWSDI